MFVFLLLLRSSSFLNTVLLLSSCFRNVFGIPVPSLRLSRSCCFWPPFILPSLQLHNILRQFSCSALFSVGCCVMLLMRAVAHYLDPSSSRRLWLPSAITSTARASSLMTRVARPMKPPQRSAQVWLDLCAQEPVQKVVKRMSRCSLALLQALFILQASGASAFAGDSKPVARSGANGAAPCAAPPVWPRTLEQLQGFWTLLGIP